MAISAGKNKIKIINNAKQVVKTRVRNQQKQHAVDVLNTLLIQLEAQKYQTKHY
jgi:hypothetical protein